MDLERERFEARNKLIDLAANWRMQTRTGGFEIVKGVTRRELESSSGADEPYLVGRGEWKDIQIPSDLYQDFRYLPATEKDIQKFASKYGLLVDGLPQHFHRETDLLPFRGEPLSLWTMELGLFNRIWDLWETAKQEKPLRVEAVLQEMGAPRPTARTGEFPFQFPTIVIPDDPIAYARKTVIRTINYSMAAGRLAEYQCGFPDCSEAFNRNDGFDFTRAELRELKKNLRPHGRPAIGLTTVAGTLRKTLWLQLACYVAGMRHLTKCHALDCKLGGWIDATESPRPGKIKYHPQCKERKKKQDR